jgi:nucleoside-diphosphate-sugar epimerase
MVEHLAQLSGCEPPQKVLPYIIPAAACRLFEGLRRLRLMRGPGPINRTALRFLGTSRSLDISRARKELGYEPKIGFREGMAATVQWIQEHDQEPTHAPTTHARAASTASPAR